MAAPPELPGYTYVRPLGSGGFADVYCYEQHMPRRTVAVKVLLGDVTRTDAQRMFLAESTVMAQLASHPSVLTVYEANLCPDGRPYLVMEYCPASYGDRFRTETIPVADVLQVAIAIGSVLETAHRQGVLHRDIKPSNILLTQYGKPVLADFGIAATIQAASGDDAVGLSVPWSAPEVIIGTTGGNIRSEVWSFAATVYALLAGRSPFEVPGKANNRDSVQARILGRESVRPTGRVDVPPRLEAALTQSMSKNPAARPESVLDLLRVIQLAESDLGMRPTTLDIPAEHSIDLTPGVAPGRVTARKEGGRVRTQRRRSANLDTTGTTGTVSGETVLRAFHAAPSRRGRAWWIVGAVTALAAAAAGVVMFTMRAGEIPRVAQIDVAATGPSLVFSWDDPGLNATDDYLVQVDKGPGSRQSSTTFTLDTVQLSGQVCVTVTVVREDTMGPVSQPACTKVP